MWPLKLKGPAVLLLTAAVAGAAHGSDTLIEELAASRFPGNEAAFGGSLSYQHAGPTGGILIGGTDTQFPVGSLRVVDIDAYRIQTSRFTFSGGASLGDARSSTTSDPLYKARVSVDAGIDAQWSLHLADQFIELDQLHGHLVSAGTEYRPTPHWGVNVSGGYGPSGTLDSRYGQLVLNWYGAQYASLGWVEGRDGYDLSNLGRTAVVQRLLQIYLKGTIPMRFGVLTLSVDTLNLEGQTRQTLRIGYKLPLRP